MKIVEVELAPCQHHHSANYDADTVIQGHPIQVLGGSRLKCMDCGEIFKPQLPPRRYTVAQIEELAKEWAAENEVANDARWIVSRFLAWLKKWEVVK